MRFSEPDMSVVVAIVASRELGRSATDQLNLLQVNICQTIKTMKLYLLVTVLITSILIVGCAKSKPVFEKSGVVQAMMSYGGPGNLSLRLTFKEKNGTYTDLITDQKTKYKNISVDRAGNAVLINSGGNFRLKVTDTTISKVPAFHVLEIEYLGEK